MDWTAQLRDAHSLLQLERGRAPCVAAAIKAWFQRLRECLRRPGRVGWSAHMQLLHLEQACLQAGLLFPCLTTDEQVPWRLPDTFLHLQVEHLPPHPLLDPTMLASSFAAVSAGNLTAAASLTWLLCDLRAAERWRKLTAVNAAANRPKARIAVCLHLFFVELWPEIHEQLRMLPEPFDLFVTLPEFAMTPQIARITVECPGVRFVPVPNRGRDVLPWLQLLNAGVLDNYEYVCKLHGKKSTHANVGALWRRDILAALLGSSTNVASLISQMDEDRTLGLLGPKATWVMAADDNAWAKNKQHLNELVARMGLPSAAVPSSFFAGTMFWYRPAALRSLAALGLSSGEFAHEMGQTDGTLAHAVERILTPVAQNVGFRVAAWDPEDSILPFADVAGQLQHSAAGVQ